MAVQKGKEFEKETAALAGVYGKRIPMSGGIGTSKGWPTMVGDARWGFPWLSKPIVLECKHGYSSKGNKAKSMSVKREWFDKHLDASKQFDFFAAFGMKFKFTSENGISKFILIPFPVMERLIKETNDIYLELCELKDEQKKRRNKRT